MALQYNETFKQYAWRSVHYELRTVNTDSFPVSPNHPRLSQAGPPPVLPNGTHGDMDPLFNSCSYQPDSPWVHYMPSPSMWAPNGLPGYPVPPIFARPSRSTGVLWIAQGDEGEGWFAASPANDLERFYSEGQTHTMSLVNDPSNSPASPTHLRT
ncbi:hypothetical protein BOTBODRAFT_182070 [Botryobasidium botryosum FD-172 SS1]|uniref:Uncharacterized protein n=1 Tax=Botryobasidium botryosum (strain FD-172 SS1) TaxID=930990 RepID=A0A067LSD8_BOTB1|nr:hypothetical protein BOTBODRAFT_182070 [Botryobasidium botryosum FD-172 SS1]